MLASNICEGMQDETIALTIPTTMKAQLGLDARPLGYYLREYILFNLAESPEYSRTDTSEGTSILRRLFVLAANIDVTRRSLTSTGLTNTSGVRIESPLGRRQGLEPIQTKPTSPDDQFYYATTDDDTDTDESMSPVPESFDDFDTEERAFSFKHEQTNYRAKNFSAQHQCALNMQQDFASPKHPSNLLSS